MLARRLDCTALLLSRALSTLVLVLTVPISALADDAVAERIVATHSVFERYCDTVAVDDFRRCYTRGGRYKRSVQLPLPAYQRRLVWDTWQIRAQRGSTFYTSGPKRSSIDDGIHDGSTARALHLFLPFVQNEKDVRKILREMKILEVSLDTMILKRQYDNSGNRTLGMNRSVRRSDGLFTCGEESPGRSSWAATLVYYLRTRPVEFVSGMAGVAFVIGLVLSIARGQPRRWGRLWASYAKGVGVMIAVLAGLSAISVLPWFSGGHPPAIAMVLILGMFAGIIVLVIAALMLAMQLGDLFR